MFNNYSYLYPDDSDVINMAADFETSSGENGTHPEEDHVVRIVTRIVVPVIFSFIAVLGFVGNLSVIVVVASNLQMRSTTNTLIISLAIADLLFIVNCVPFTAVAYNGVWPFGRVWCKVSICFFYFSF